MKGKESKCAAVRLEKSRLMAAMAILAVAFVVLAAVPAVMTESDAATNTFVITSDTDAAKLNAEPETAQAGYWTWSSNELTLSADLILNVTGNAACSTLKTIDVGAFTLTIQGSGTLKLSALADIDGTGSIVITGKLTAKDDGLAIDPKATVSGTISAKNGVTFNEDSTISGTINGKVVNSGAKDMVLSGATIAVPSDATAADALTNTDADGTITGSAKLTAGSGEAMVAITDGTVDLSLGTVTSGSTIADITAAKNLVLTASGNTMKIGAITGGGAVTHNTDKGFVFAGAVTKLSGIIDGKIKFESTVAFTSGSLTTILGTVSTGVATIGAAKEISVVQGATLTLSSADISTNKILDYGGKLIIGDTQQETGDDYVAAAYESTKINSETELLTALSAADKSNGATAEQKIVTLGNDIEITDDLTIPEGVTLVLAGENITVPTDMKVINQGTFGATGDSGKILPETTISGETFFENADTVVKAILGDSTTADLACVTLTDVSGSFGASIISTSDTTVTGITISGTRIIGNEKTDATIASIKASAGTLTFGKISMEKNIYLEQTTGNITLKDLTVNNGATLKLKDNSTADVSGTMSVYGDVSAMTGSTDANISVAENQTYRMYNGSTLKNVTLKGEGTIDVSQAQRVNEQGQDIGEDKNFGALESVEIIGSLNIWNNSVVNVYGGFSVDSGVTLTIEKGSKLIINSVIADMKIAGTIVVEEGAYFTVSAAESVEISGAIKSEGELTINAGTTVKSGGSITAMDADASKIVVKTLAVENGATVTVKADMTITDITNKGSVILDGAKMICSGSKISMAAADAAVEIKSVSGAFELKITDSGLVFADKASVSSSANSVSFTPQAGAAITGLTVTEKVTYSSSTSKYSNGMEISGTISQTTDASSLTEQTITVDGKKGITIPGEVDLGKKIKLSLGGKITVSGTLKTTVSAGTDASSIEVPAGAEVTVSGLIQSEGKITPVGTLNAAEYQYKDGTADVYRYSTLAKALEDKAEYINVLGTISVTTDLTIPSGTTVRGGIVKVGSSSNRDITLYVEDGAAMKNSSTIVDATLYFENKKNNGTSVTSDVSIVGDVDSTYTNIYTALNNAEAGDVVTITRDEAVELGSDVTIKDGVTLNVPASKTLKVVKPITITVNGILKSYEDIDFDSSKVTGFAVKADTTTKKAALTLGTDGIVMVNTPDSTAYSGEYDLYKTAGAYFHLVDSVGDYYYITSVAYAATVLANTTDVSVSGTSYSAVLFGTLAVGDVAFSGDSTKAVSVLYAGSSYETSPALTVSSITLSKATFVSDEIFTGTIAVGDASVVLKKVESVTATTTVSKDGYTLDVDVGDGENASAAVATGAVCVKSADNITVNSGATMKAAYAGSKITTAVVNGTLDVAAGRSMELGTLSVYGSVVAQPASGSDGKADLKVEKMYVGVSAYDVGIYSGASASVSGEVAVSEYAVVAEGSTIASETSNTFGKKFTEYYVGSTKWITVYDLTTDNSTKISMIVKAPVTNAYFAGTWSTSAGYSATGVAVGTEYYDKVYADITYEIYQIVIKADQGIGDLYLNGNIMSKGFVNGEVAGKNTQYYAYWAIVTAGDYEVTCKLANGYSGTAVLKDMDGKTVSNNKFTASGNPASGEKTITMNYQLTGIEKSGYVDPVEPEEKDDGLTVTDYLLIVLVILVVVLAVIVAMRLMRS